MLHLKAYRVPRLPRQQYLEELFYHDILYNYYSIIFIFRNIHKGRMTIVWVGNLKSEDTKHYVSKSPLNKQNECRFKWSLRPTQAFLSAMTDAHIEERD